MGRRRSVSLAVVAGADAGRHDGRADLQHGDVVGAGHDGLHHLGRQRGAGLGGAEHHDAVGGAPGVVDKTHPVGGLAGGLEERREHGRAVLHAAQLLRVVVVQDDVHGEHLPLDVGGERGNGAHPSIVYCQHRNSLPAVDLVGELRLTEEAVERGEVGKLAKDSGDVEGCRR